MRRFLLLALMAVLSLGFGLLASCGDDDDDDSGDDDDSENDDDATDDTWADSTSGLTWQLTSSSDYMTWDDAKTYCSNLSLAGGGWHLPTISELRSLIRGCDATELGGVCGVADGWTESDCWSDPCGGCGYLEGPGSGGAYWPDGMSGEIEWYWSSSPVADDGLHAWYVGFFYGDVDNGYVGRNDGRARCVR